MERIIGFLDNNEMQNSQLGVITISTFDSNNHVTVDRTESGLIEWPKSVICTSKTDGILFLGNSLQVDIGELVFSLNTEAQNISEKPKTSYFIQISPLIVSSTILPQLNLSVPHGEGSKIKLDGGLYRVTRTYPELERTYDQRAAYVLTPTEEELFTNCYPALNVLEQPNAWQDKPQIDIFKETNIVYMTTTAAQTIEEKLTTAD